MAARKPSRSKSQSARRTLRSRVESEAAAGRPLRSMDLRGADLRRVKLNGAMLYMADLGGSDLRGADLTGSNLVGATLVGVDLQGAKLASVLASEAFFSESNLQSVDFRRAMLWHAKLRRADLRGADLGGANLSGADVSGSDLSGANLFGADLTDVVWDENTVWPDEVEFIEEVASEPEPWVVLGVRPDATVEEIKKAYRQGALRSHPDVVPSSASADEKARSRERFEQLTRAKDAMLASLRKNRRRTSRPRRTSRRSR